MKRIVAAALFFSLSACSSMRLRYGAQVESDGQEKRFTYENSYDVGGGIPTICALTAIFLGGACWYYLVMPTVPDQKKAQDDGEAALKKEMGQKLYSVKSYQVDLHGWKSEPPAAAMQ